MKKFFFTAIIVIILLGFTFLFRQTKSPTTQQIPTPTSEYKGTPILPNTESAHLYFIALEDNGQQGEMIGCNDSVVPVLVEIPGEEDQIQAALERLLSIKNKTYPGTDLYNSLSQSTLTLDSVTVTDTVADVRLSGEVVAGGVCDNPRIEAQLRQTILQFQNVSEVQIYVNDEPLSEVLSLQ